LLVNAGIQVAIVAGQADRIRRLEVTSDRVVAELDAMRQGGASHRHGAILFLGAMPDGESLIARLEAVSKFVERLGWGFRLQPPIYANASSSDFASFRSAVSKPSVNQQ
jgi:hypothetical protein